MKPWTLTICCPLCELELTLDVSVEPGAFTVEAWDSGKSTCVCDPDTVEALPVFAARIWAAIEDRDTSDYDRAMDARIDAREIPDAIFDDTRPLTRDDLDR